MLGGYLRATHPQVPNARLDGLLRAEHGDLVVVGRVRKVGQPHEGLQLHQGVRPAALGSHLHQLPGGRRGVCERGEGTRGSCHVASNSGALQDAAERCDEDGVAPQGAKSAPSGKAPRPWLRVRFQRAASGQGTHTWAKGGTVKSMRPSPLLEYISRATRTRVTELTSSLGL